MSMDLAIAHYRIIARIGEGGMGAVYRATDTKLARDVAIKVLPDAFANDADRLSRFTREAQVLASLNHPSIAAVYGIEERAIVMELVEGPTLADRIAQGPLPLDEALAIARQMADALEAAHEKGIIHRDLKPANVKVTPDGKVKVLDFGLAKLADPAKAEDPASAPTIVRGNSPTLAGMIMGTAGYMAPEQARGLAVDKRADIWAFGVVLYEMLTGHELHSGGETVADTLAAVLAKDPDWSLLPSSLPYGVRRLLQRCLEKDRTKRLRDIGEAWVWIEEKSPGFEKPTPVSNRGRYIQWAAIALIAAAVPTAWFLKPKADPPLVQFEIPQPKDVTTDNSFGMLALSPDGTTIVYRAIGKDQKQMLWLRRLSETSWKALPGTENATQPFWSPDSRTIGFFADGKMKRIDAVGGAVQIICDADPAGASWSKRDEIFWQQNGKPFQKVSAGGGDPEPVFAGDTQPRDGSTFALLPDGVHFLFDNRKESGCHIGSLSDKRVDRVLVPGPSFNAFRCGYVTDPSGGGWLIYTANRQVVARRLDISTMQLSGSVLLLTSEPTNSNWSVSTNGMVAFPRRQTAHRQLSWVSRTGSVLETIEKPGDIGQVRIGPDGKSILYDDARQVIRYDSLTRTATSVTSASVNAGSASSSRDGTRVFLFQDPPRGVFERAMSGVGGQRMIFQGQGHLGGVSQDERWYLISMLRVGKFSAVLVPAQGGVSIPVSTEAVQPMSASFSPDGRWIVYSSLVQGRREIFVSPLPKEAGGSQQGAVTWQISREGGDQPVWRGDGKEIVYYSVSGHIVSVPVVIQQEQLRTGSPVVLFPVRLRPASNATYDITADGSRLMIPLLPPGESDETSIGFILNWPKLRNRAGAPE